MQIITHLQQVKHISATGEEIISCRLLSSELKSLHKEIQMTLK